jgi:hypothetical protein
LDGIVLGWHALCERSVMKNQPARFKKSLSNPFATGRLTVRPNPNFATTTNRLQLQKAYDRLNWLTVLRSARVAGLNA